MTLVLPLRSTNSFLPLSAAEEGEAAVVEALRKPPAVELVKADREGKLGVRLLARALHAGGVASPGAPAWRSGLTSESNRIATPPGVKV